MHSITTFIKVLGFAVFLVVVQGCSEEGIIGEKDMAVIISEIYLADQALETKPELKMQTDSILVYPAIMERNGYTLEMYEKSMRYYMQEGDSYSNILKAANILENFFIEFAAVGYHYHFVSSGDHCGFYRGFFHGPVGNAKRSIQGIAAKYGSVNVCF